MERAYRYSTRALSAVLLALGVAIVAITVIRGGGALAVGVLLGLTLSAIGAGRLVLARGDRRRRA